MPGGIDLDMNLSEAMGEIEELESDIQILRGKVQQEVDEAVRITAKNFRDEVQTQIKKSDIETRTGELLNSWKVRPKGLAQYEVRSTADHAVFLELGTTPHTITGSDGWLKFIPEDPTPYPERNFSEDNDGEVTGDFNEDGLVVSHLDPLSDAEAGTYFAQSVQHPGNEAYGYFQNAYDKKPWKIYLNNRIRDRIERVVQAFEAGG